MNLNKGCIEIVLPTPFYNGWITMNLNKGCIEIVGAFFYIMPVFDEP